MSAPACLSVKTGIPHLTVPYVPHSSEILVDLTDFYKFIKQHHNDSDKKGVPRRNNIRIEVTKYEYGVKERDSIIYLSLGAILRYCFSHADDFSICRNIVDDITRTLVSQTSNTNAQQSATPSDKTTFQLYREIASSNDLDSIGGSNIKVIELEDSKIDSINISYRDAFTLPEWKRIQLFEFQFSLINRERKNSVSLSGSLEQLHSAATENKWAFWNSVKTSLNFGEQIQKLNARVCSYQRERMHAAEAIEGVTLLVGKVQHLPNIIEEAVITAFLEYQIKGIGNVISVDCCESCSHDKGIHIFLEASTDLVEASSNDLSTIIRSTFRDHAPIKEIVFVQASGLSQFCTGTETARFSMRDKFLQKKLNDEILLIDKEDSNDYNEVIQDDDEEQHQQKNKLCTICYNKFSDWLESPLSVSSHDQLSEWLLFVPLPVRLFIERAFLNDNSLKNSQNASEFLKSKVPRLSTIYEASLNTFNRNYFGPSQEMNTAELVVNYHNATTVFGIAQSSGISMSLVSAEKKLKQCANKERLYFETYLKHYPMEYETLTDSSAKSSNVSLRECHLIFLVDNLIRTQKKRDPESGRMKSIQLCTLPITVKGLPRNSKVTDSWHTSNCDGSDSCSCKDGSKIAKTDIFNTFLSYTEEEGTQIELFRHEAVWGMNYLLQHSLIKPIMDSAAETHHPLKSSDTAAEDLTLSFQDMSIQEVDRIEGVENDLEKSIADMSLGDEKDDQNNRIEGVENDLEKSISDLSFEDETDDQNNHLHQLLNDQNDDDDLYDDDAETDTEPETSSTSSESSFESDHDPSEPEETIATCKVQNFSHETSEKQQTSNQEMSHKIHPDVLMDSLSENQTENQSDPYISSVLSIDEDENGTAIPLIPTQNNVSSFIKYDVPPLLCRHPPPAVGKDDDIKVLRTILNEVIIKSGHFLHSTPNKEKILLAPDHKIAKNVFNLMEEPQFHCLLPEFPVLHLLKSKITNLISAYEPAGIRELLKYMKDDDEETDWKKLVSLAEIECAARNIRRLSLSLHIAIFVTYLESLCPLESDNLVEDLKQLSPQDAEQRWGTSYDAFIQQSRMNNATFCLHLDIMNHCDEIVGIQLTERIGGPQGYSLLLALVKKSLPFSFLNGASSYAGFCIQLLYEHYQASFFHKRMKECLFTTPHKGFASNFALDAQREMDHRDAIKSFRSSGSIESILPRMAVVDNLQAIRNVRNTIYQNTHENKRTAQQADQYLGKTLTEKDMRFVSRCVQMILRKKVLTSSKDSIPKNVYQKSPQPLSECILDARTEETGKYLIKRYICKMKLGGTDPSDCPDLKDIQGPADLIQKLKSSKGTTIQRHRIKANVQKTEKELIEEKRVKEMKKLNKITQHSSSVMNTCQAIVNPDCSKPDTNKSQGMKDAIAYALVHNKEAEMHPQPKETLAATRDRRKKLLQEDGLAYFQCSSIPTSASKNVKVVTVEFAGVKFWAYAKTGRDYLSFVQNRVLAAIFKDFTEAQHIIICEEKYSFTPDIFKALTREKRQKDSVDVSHLKTSEEMLSMEAYNRAALTKTFEGKRLASSFLAANIHEIKLDRKCIIDIDSEHLVSECTCAAKADHEMKPCKQHAIPVRAQFGEGGIHLETKALQSIKQRKGEAELAQADWLPITIPELEEHDAVLSYVTSGDIDTVPIHILAVSEFWPRLPNQKFKNDIFLLLKKPKKDMMPDIYCITKMVENIEANISNRDIGVIVAFVLCLGGNDYIPKFHGISHLQWMMTILQDRMYCDNLFKIVRNRLTHAIESVTLNEDTYISVLKELYCPKKLRHGQWSYEEIRQMSIKLPEKQIKTPQQWLPPLSAVKKVTCLIQSQIDYLLSVCKPEADLPDFIGNGGLRRTKEGDIVYDLGEDIRYNHEQELITIPDEVMKERICQASKTKKMHRKKRGLSESPKKEDGQGAKRAAMYTSTPRKIKGLRMKRQGSTEGDNKPDNCDTENVSMDGFQPIEEDSEDL